jgi:4-amino-4-deoxy-L-arabinose transferase-like glycosyltransferase
MLRWVKNILKSFRERNDGRLVVTIFFALSVFGPGVCFAQAAKNLIPAYEAISTPDFGYVGMVTHVSV